MTTAGAAHSAGDAFSHANVQIHLVLGHSWDVVDDLGVERLPSGATAAFGFPLDLVEDTTVRRGTRLGRSVRLRGRYGKAMPVCISADRSAECDGEGVGVDANQAHLRMGGAYRSKVVPVA